MKMRTLVATLMMLSLLSVFLPLPMTSLPAAAANPAVQMVNDPKLGPILTDGNGMTLYTFKNDKMDVSNCSGTCANNWPAFTVAQGVMPTVGQGVTGKVATFTRPDGKIQVTYDGMPLYYFIKDTAPGDTKGEKLLNLWSVVMLGPTAMKPAAAMPQAEATGAAMTPAATTPETTTAAAAMPAPPTATGGKIALLLPETKTTRYETADRPDFEAEIKKLCPACDIIYSNANQDANTQLSQVEAALSNGAQVLVLDPVDSKSAAAAADKAKAQGVPVIAYDRLILNSDGVNYYISFDNFQVGVLQAQSLVDKLNQMKLSNPQIVMINGSPTDNNAGQFKAGAHSVFDPLVKAGKLTIAKEYDTPDWSPDQAQNEMQQALTALGNKVDGVYCANDGTASGAIAAMKSAGLNPLPPVTGQDAELGAIQRILTGEQYMTVYKAIKPEASTAADLAMYLLTKTAVPPQVTAGKTVNNGKIDVPSVLLTPIAVTKANIKDTIVKDGFWTVKDICTAQYADACKAAGLQ